MTTVEVLESAYRLLLTRGWCQGHYENSRKELCTLGSLMWATVGCATWTWGIDEASVYLIRAAGIEPVDNLAVWNDDRRRTPEEILQVFQQAIQLAKDDEAKELARIQGECLIGGQEPREVLNEVTR